MDNELNERLRSVLRELREVTVKLECQLAVAASEAAEAVNGFVQAATHCEMCTHRMDAHGGHGCVVPDGDGFCSCMVTCG